MTLSPAQRARRVRRPWRWALLVFSLAITTGTHWPKLHLGTPEMPAPDKIIHMLAFGTLAVLLWRSGWLKRLWQVGAIAAAWAAIDELSQALPGLGRTVSWQDLMASELGVACAVGWCWALAPVGGTAKRCRLELQRLAWDEVFARPGAWLRAALGGAVGGAAMLWGGWLCVRGGTGSLRGPLVVVLLLGAAGALLGAWVLVVPLYRRQLATLQASHSCSACGASCAQILFDDRGRGHCPSCAAPLHRGQWTTPVAAPTHWSARRMLGLAGIMVVTGAALATVKVSLNSFSLPLADDLRIGAMLALVSLAASVAVRYYRQGPDAGNIQPA